MNRQTESASGQLFQPAIRGAVLHQTVADYVNLYDARSVEERRRQASELSRTYYDLVTDFYEYGWGHSFHFAPLGVGETLAVAIARYEQYIALRLGLKSGQSVLDLGCGVGGPMRAIARFSDANVVGINNCEYQLGRATWLTREEGMEARCRFLHGDFTNMPLDATSFDAAYTIEATCHAADRRTVFAEAYRVLAPGGLFAGYEWCLTDRYDDGVASHREIRHGIEKGNGLPELVNTVAVDAMLREVGFQPIDAFDMAHKSSKNRPWYSPLEARASLSGFLHSRAGSWFTRQLVRALESARLSPRGTTDAHDLLRLAQRSLVAGGRSGIFTPMYFFLVRKGSSL